MATCAAKLPSGAGQVLVTGLKAGESEKKEPQGRTPYKVYFIGHSLYSFGSVPAAVQFLSEAANVDRPIKATVYTRGGGTHQNYWETPEVMKRLREEPWDIVIIAGNVNDMANPDKVNLEYGKKLDNEAKKRNIRVLEYLAWPWVQVSGDQVFEKRMKAQDAFNQPLIRLVITDSSFHCSGRSPTMDLPIQRKRALASIGSLPAMVAMPLDRSSR